MTFTNHALLTARWVLAGLWALAGSAAAQPLTLSDAQALAVAEQPLLRELDARTLAAREAAVAAEQLPDPQLFGGVRDLPVTTRDAYSLSDDSDTQLVIGIAQEFPRAEKRRLRGALRLKEADRLTAQRALRDRQIRRDSALDWLARWRDERARELSQALYDAIALQSDAVAIAVRTGRAGQAELTLVQLAQERQRDDVAAREQAVARSIAALRRWIGDAATQPLPSAPPQFAVLPPLAAMLERLPQHPVLATLQARIDEASATTALADAAYLPDWRIELAYGNRLEFSDMVMLQVGMDLPVFTRNRQDRRKASALALRDAAAEQWQDAIRQLESDVTLRYGDYRRLTDRATQYDTVIVPQAQRVIDATLTTWRTGNGSLPLVIDAQRAALEARLAQLDVRRDAIAQRIALDYLNAVEG